MFCYNQVLIWFDSVQRTTSWLFYNDTQLSDYFSFSCRHQWFVWSWNQALIFKSVMNFNDIFRIYLLFECMSIRGPNIHFLYKIVIWSDLISCFSWWQVSLNVGYLHGFVAWLLIYYVMYVHCIRWGISFAT